MVDGMLNGDVLRVYTREGDDSPQPNDTIALIQFNEKVVASSTAKVYRKKYYPQEGYYEVYLMSFYKNGHKVNDGQVHVRIISRPFELGKELI